MATFTSSTYTFVSPHSFLTHFRARVFPSCFCGINPGNKGNSVSLKLNLVRGLVFGEDKKRVSWWSCCCKKGWDNDGDLALEADILEFMKNSDKPEAFPSKKELVDAGRMDLVEGIKRQGGWLAMGWDLDDDDEHGFQEKGFPEAGVKDWDLLEKEKKWDNQTFQERAQSEVEISGASYLAVNSSSSTSSSVGGPHRRKLMSFSGSSGLGNDTTAKFIQDQPLSGIDGLRNPTWREWSLQRAGIAGKEFEDISGYGTLEIRNKSNELDRRKESRASGKDINHNEIRDRLEHLKLELSSVLQSLRSNVDEVLSREGDESSIDNFHKLSDASEFQENEISNAQDKLRSLRARLAVLEGKMTLAIIDAQKTVEEKQKRIDDARRALQLLRTACIVWPNSGSEVLLAGSFDGWATKRKMEKSSTGVFSLQLKLYPGKYEIKFIVDGEWKLDPLRPIVNNNGFENNLLIIT
uniref:AMP-activated protein kinase glycogen-binding domain-containing protein n=1 Tax=Gossypium raimondii TaxID=29730 RepID=A0A0D2PVG7_GOSRA|nr:hypothetical protein B456_005G189700 [Gossypium raimondii]